MTGDSWFRNTHWDDSIAQTFEQRLKRAQRKGQYLRIQASTLADANPEICLQVLDRYFALGEDFDLAQGHVDRANALLALGRPELAYQSYEAALERERQFPKMRTTACLDFPFLIAVNGARSRFDQAMTILTGIDMQLALMFPVDRFKYHATRALILVGCDPEAARTAAMAALDAAGFTDSGFRYHRSVGLVKKDQGAVISRLRVICADDAARPGNKT